MHVGLARSITLFFSRFLQELRGRFTDNTLDPPKISTLENE